MSLRIPLTIGKTPFSLPQAAKFWGYMGSVEHSRPFVRGISGTRDKGGSVANTPDALVECNIIDQARRLIQSELLIVHLNIET